MAIKQKRRLVDILKIICWSVALPLSVIIILSMKKTMSSAYGRIHIKEKAEPLI